MRIVEVLVSPIAKPDVPLANTKGVHPSVFPSDIIQVITDNGLVGLGEAYGAARTLTGLRTVAPMLEGLDPHYGLRIDPMGARTAPSAVKVVKELDEEAVAELHALYNLAMVKDRDDTDEMLKYIPEYVRQVPRW